ncbi:S-adenosylmethionine tRNA ribosyltransferase [Niastella yeongjuensis]|uniref:S-adenosylmethionine tRNA ribosyltransferase n=1 Tax=Niastella yeongjuensis TaxID=354355 RepID=A0A1V9ENR7_9BACT|nr:S-adenosylmethionine:tRNA ribosyltransferase-isomerase [Niastella yeongjuensis]OQP47766.1 S-adenosylmethionine tRNA ribosyltransferase [Niastella yeongjuensis]SEP45395.1 S-adenosylmethionine:tRNA ribosyltransferase-isomerase [Niastella yeongjuensis]
MHPKDLSVHDFTYELPEQQIARYPLPERDSSRLLIYKEGALQEAIYRDIYQHLPPDSLLIFNNTKVVAARLLFQKPTGAVVEIFCLEPPPQYADMTTAMTQKGRVTWICLIGGASKWKPGQILEKKMSWNGQEIVLQARYLGKEKDSFAIELSWEPASLTFAEVLHVAGNIPLPPYIKREVEQADSDRYQTIYANTEGSVAAPTAGLHFTDTLFEQLDRKQIQREYVTLHVGAGTFKPVKSETMGEHPMHAEFIDVNTGTIARILQYLDKHITVVGTTSLRTIESLYWLGVKTVHEPNLPLEDLVVHQWDPYELNGMPVTAKAALESLLQYMHARKMDRIITKTSLLIAPGYTFQIPRALVTNFHQPQSTLLLLVAAFVGNDWRKIYTYALENEFRFLSYGDGCLLFRQ